MSNNGERFWVGFLFFWRAFLMTMLLLIGFGLINGCGGGGDDDPNCGMTDNCGPDAGTTDDTNPADPDAGTTPPDGNNDVCADYQWMAEKPWDCVGNWDNGNFVCENIGLSLSTDGGHNGCLIKCGDDFDFEFKHWDSGLTISRTPPPPTLDYVGGGWQIHCTQRQ